MISNLLTYYRWVSQNCQKANYVLKSDDDQAIDVFHLPKYLDTFVEPSKEKFYLCYILEKTKPQRAITNKWFVSFQDFPGEYYPNYCAGWAYVTNIATINQILGS